MAKVVGDVAVSVGADVSPLKRGLRGGTRELNRFGDNAGRVGRRMAKVGAAITAALTVGATAAHGLAARSAELGKEIGNLSRIAGTTPETFQRWAIAADTVGISQEKLADILKDMQDRVGDFIATQGGPMKDFFENIAPKVGVTADQFARLSGPEALQLYVSSLERANVTQNEMTFYMEALASDSTALIPILRQNGFALRQLGDEAATAGRIMSNETVDGAAELDRKLTEVKDTINNDLVEAMIEMEDELIVLAEFVRDYGIPALKGLIEFGADAAEMLRNVAAAMAFIRDPANAVGGDVAENIGESLGIDPNGTGPGKKRPKDAWKDLYGIDSEDVADEGSAEPFDLGTVTLGTGSGSGSGSGSGGSGGGGGRRGPSREDFEALRASLATEREIIAEDYQERLEQLEEYRQAEILKEGEFADTKLRIEEEHLRAMKELQRAEMRARLDGYASMFGDLSALMNSENKKLFQIGKAASIAQATIKGYEAAVDAWSKGMKIGGPPMAAAFTAASVLRTGALISNIASTSYGGGGGAAAAVGGGAGASAAAQAPAAPEPQQVNLNIGDAEFLPRAAVISLAEKLQELSREGAIVTVN
ncbi:hypothetical protein [Roseovarius sp. C03]|uniref:hypothetical protein n=1 Tax=Roseovarius sp. C03 TaxID=3449222 RepID=UPI003EDC7B12